MRRRFLSAMGTSLFVFAGIAATASPGYAIGNGVCSTGEYCYYQNSNYGPSVLDDFSSTPDFNTIYYYNTSTTPNDRTSSVWNRSTSQVMYLYQDHGYSGNKSCFGLNRSTATLPNSTYGNLGNDSASSMLTASSCP
ncbi:MAG: peptidase inhibitor family I36 protein [Acidobacteriales bacterium]|nr:peptidase inhibitor family I36 protein [Terriglobales bacterium]